MFHPLLPRAVDRLPSGQARRALRLAVLGALAVLATPLDGRGAGAQGHLAVRWTKHVPLARLSQINALLRRPGYPLESMARQGHLPWGLGNGGELPSCDDYFKGRHSSEPLDPRTEDLFKEACLPLRYLAHASPSRVSYVRSLRLDQGLLALLPACLAPTLEDSPAEVARATRAGRTFAEADGAWRLKRKDPTGAVFKNPDHETLEVLVEALGDFDGDGVEDLLIEVNSYSTGTLSEHHQIALTRTSAKGALQIVDSDEPELCPRREDKGGPPLSARLP